jgi:uncharacterized protein (DUF2147 family)
VQSAAAEIDGLWITADGDGWIEIRTTDGQPGGFIKGSPQDPDNLRPPRFDDKNPDPALRQRPLLGLQIVHDLRTTGDNKWKGRIYDPNSGKTYKCTITLADENTLKLRGYIGISLLGRTEVWTRER